MLEGLSVFLFQELRLFGVVAIYTREPKQIRQAQAKTKNSKENKKLKPIERLQQIGGGPGNWLGERENRNGEKGKDRELLKLM